MSSLAHEGIEPCVEERTGHTNAIEYNDEYGRTREEILSLIECAAERIEAGVD